MHVMCQCLDGIRETVLQRAPELASDIYLVGVWNLDVEEALDKRFLVPRQFAQQRRLANASAAPESGRRTIEAARAARAVGPACCAVRKNANPPYQPR